jgi:flagella basal body P-ring formation protein FlgA
MNISVRKSIIIIAFGILVASPAGAENAWMATHNLTPGDVLRADDVEIQPLTQPAPDALPTTRDVIGQEVKRRIYSGHPVGIRDIGLPTIVKVNMPVDVHWEAGGLSLILKGNALDAGSVGDQIRVLNPATSRTIHGIITADGTIEVRSAP